MCPKTYSVPIYRIITVVLVQQQYISGHMIRVVGSTDFRLKMILQSKYFLIPIISSPGQSPGRAIVLPRTLASALVAVAAEALAKC